MQVRARVHATLAGATMVLLENPTETAWYAGEGGWLLQLGVSDGSLVQVLLGAQMAVLKGGLANLTLEPLGRVVLLLSELPPLLVDPILSAGFVSDGALGRWNVSLVNAAVDPAAEGGSIAWTAASANAALVACSILSDPAKGDPLLMIAPAAGACGTVALHVTAASSRTARLVMAPVTVYRRAPAGLIDGGFEDSGPNAGAAGWSFWNWQGTYVGERTARAAAEGTWSYMLVGYRLDLATRGCLGNADALTTRMQISGPGMCNTTRYLIVYLMA